MAKDKAYLTKPFHIRPITGLVDYRSTPEQIPLGGYRHVENWEALDDKKVCRMPGWTKVQDGAAQYGNQDLHDQLLSEALVGAWNLRQPIIFLYEAQDLSNINHLFAATQNRLYAKVESTGNWRIIWDTLADGVTAPGGTPVAGCPT